MYNGNWQPNPQNFYPDPPPNQHNFYHQHFPPISPYGSYPNPSVSDFKQPTHQKQKNIPKDLYLYKELLQKKEALPDKINQDDTSSQSSHSSIELKRKWISPHKSYSNLKSDEWKILSAKALSALQDNKHNGHEIATLTKILQLNRSDFDRIKIRVQNDLMFCLRGLNFKKVYLFGSAVTGLDFYGSDLDFHVMLTETPSRGEATSKLLLQASRLVHQQKRFQMLCRIDQARIPLLRCLHSQSNIMCDINFTSGDGLYNSNFISFIIQFDPRIRELMFVLKYWAKSHNITDKCKVSSYCLNILVIFFLQNLKKPMLLSIKSSQEGINRLKTASGIWNFNYSAKMNLTARNTQTTRELLEGFFEFYKSYDYSQFIVSVYTGSSILRTEFEDHPDLEIYRTETHKNNLIPLNLQVPFIVQDGFELNLNVACKTKPNCDELFGFIGLTHSRCQLLKSESFSNMLHKMLAEPIIPAVEESSKRSKRSNKSFYLKTFATEADLKICRDILNLTDTTKIYGQIDVNRFFVQHVMSSVCKILEDLYLMELEKLKPNNCEGSKNEIQLWKVQLPFDTVTSRKKFNFTSDETVALEKAQSKKKLEQKNPFDLSVQLLMHSHENSEFKFIEVKFEDFINKKKSALSQFSTLFAVNINPAVRYYLKKKLEGLHQVANTKS